MSWRTGTTPIVAVATPSIAAIVIVRAAVIVAALAAYVAILFALVAANLTSLFRRQDTVGTICTSLGANLALAFAYLTSLVTRYLTGADAPPNALAV